MNNLQPEDYQIASSPAANNRQPPRSTSLTAVMGFIGQIKEVFDKDEDAYHCALEKFFKITGLWDDPDQIWREVANLFRDHPDLSSQFARLTADSHGWAENPDRARVKGCSNNRVAKPNRSEEMLFKVEDNKGTTEVLVHQFESAIKNVEKFLEDCKSNKETSMVAAKYLTVLDRRLIEELYGGDLGKDGLEMILENPTTVLPSLKQELEELRVY